jgi:hypothetical protein
VLAESGSKYSQGPYVDNDVMKIKSKDNNHEKKMEAVLLQHKMIDLEVI